MSLIGKALKIGMVAKAVQLAQREANKPENRQKITEAVNKLKNRRSSGNGSTGI